MQGVEKAELKIWTSLRIYFSKDVFSKKDGKDGTRRDEADVEKWFLFPLYFSISADKCVN